MGMKPRALPSGIQVATDNRGQASVVLGPGATANELATWLDARPTLTSLEVKVTASDQLGDAIAGIIRSPRLGITELAIAEVDFDASDELADEPVLPDGQLDDALPDLRSLSLACNSLFGTISHRGLERLDMVGIPITASFFDAPAALAKLTRLRWTLTEDVHGVCVEPNALATLFAADGLPALTHLDLSAATLDGDIASEPAFAEGALRAQLQETLLADPDTSAPAPAIKGDVGPWTYAGWLSAHAVFDLPKDEHIPDMVAALQPDAGITDVHLSQYDFEPGPFATLARALAGTASLRRLRFDSPHIYGLQAAHLAALADAYAGNDSLRSLEIVRNRIGEDGWPHVARLIAGTKLTALEISQARDEPTAADMAALTDAITASGSIESLVLRSLCDDKTAPVVAELIAGSKSLRSLEVKQLDDSPASVQAICDGLERNTEIHSLAIGPLESDEAVLAVCRALEGRQLSSLTLTGLDLKAGPAADALPALIACAETITLDGEADSTSAQLIARALGSSQRLRVLNLEDWELDDDQIPGFMEQIAGNPRLRELVGPEGLTDDGVSALSKATGLRRLRRAPLRYVGQLVDALPQLTELDLTQGSAKRTKYLGDVLAAAARHGALTTLNLSGLHPRPEFRDSVDKALAELVTNTTTLTELGTRWWGYTAKGFKKFERALANNGSIETLHALDRQIKPALAARLRNLVGGHPSLKHVD